ncbi:hypothetical protein CK203_036163 [Vitis vinifera]|uniref:DUF659 domain-containing protein n=1 Tax=Vitis vinifera TaxID=29760 RepID=A0A438IWQ9_VITVI|nr:hypothetical protein CK203_036163 [Vitis vinifera]
MVYNKTKAKANKVANIQEIRAKLCGSMGVGDTHLINEEDDDEDVEDQDVYMYPTNMHPDEWSAHRSAVCASKATEWERQQYENIVGSKHKTRKSSHPTCTPTMMRKSQNNGSAFVKARKLLIKKFNLYWTLCTTHCINLIFEDIIKRPSVIDVIYNARKITNFIYNHGRLLTQMRKYCGGDIVRLKTTRHGVGSDSKLLQAVHNVFAKLDPTIESLGQFGNELVLFRDAKKGFSDQATVTAWSTMVPDEYL